MPSLLSGVGQLSQFAKLWLCTGMTVVHSDMHTREPFLKMSVSLGLGVVFVCLFRFSILCVFFWFSLDCFVLVLFGFVVLALVSSLLCQKIGSEECLYFCVEWDAKC